MVDNRNIGELALGRGVNEYWLASDKNGLGIIHPMGSTGSWKCDRCVSFSEFVFYNLTDESGGCMLVADVLAQMLVERGVRFAFGMPGGATVPLMAAFQRAGIEFILVRHEGSAGFMADAVSQRTGGLGVCVSTLGPGATNLVSGVAQAYTERSRVLAIIGQCEDDLRLTYTHQIIDQEAIFTPISALFHRLRPSYLSQQMRRVFRQVDEVSMPVVLELSSKLSRMSCQEVPSIGYVMRGDAPVDVLVQRIQGANNPILLIGAENLKDSLAHSLTSFAEDSNIPVMTTYRAKGMCNEISEWSVGSCGLSPVVDEIQHELLQTSDLVILVGFDMVEMRPNWLDDWYASITLISMSEYGQLDIPSHIEIDWRGDLSQGIADLSNALVEWVSSWSLEAIRPHKKRIESIFTEKPVAIDERKLENPACVIHHLQQELPEDVVLCLDVGAHRITASHVWKCTHPRQILQSNGFSSMGVGLPMAISVALYEPDRTVVALTGDMGLWMSLGELGLIQERNLNIIVVYLADSALSLIELKQERSDTPEPVGVHFENPDVLSLARAFNGHGHQCTTLEQLSHSIEKAQQGGLHLIEMQIDSRYYRLQM